MQNNTRWLSGGIIYFDNTCRKDTDRRLDILVTPVVFFNELVTSFPTVYDCEQSDQK